MSVRELLAEGVALLRRDGRLDRDHEAALLLAHVLGLTPGTLLLAPEVPTAARAEFLTLIGRRQLGIPLQHLTGVAHFRHTSVRVGPGVFVPRPETEVMVGWALERLAGLAEPLVVDLCSGSGVIAKSIAQECPGAEVWAVEQSPAAVAWASENLAGTGVRLVEADMAEAPEELDGRVDLVICNPPYIPLEAYESVPAEVRDHDPELALFSGEDGLDAMRVLSRVAARLLRPGGFLAAEHAEVQHESAQAVFLGDPAWSEVRDHVDLAGRPRFVTAVRTERVRMSR